MQNRNITLLSCLIILAALLFFNSTTAQSIFQKRYQSATGQEFGFTAIPANDGSILIAGHTNYDDMLVFKTNGSGDLTWSNTYGGNEEDIAYKARPTTDGGSIVVGSTKSFGAGEKDVVLMKLTSTGSVSWTQTFGTVKDDIGYDVLQTADGGYIITGAAYYSTNVTEGRILLIKTSSSGQVSWSKMFGESMGNEGRHIMVDSDGGYLIFGTASNGFILIIKTTSNGTPLWSENFLPIGYGGPDVAQVIRTSDNGFAFTGTLLKNSDLKQKVFFIKTDASGSVQTTKVYGTNFQNKGFGIVATSYGYLIAGHSDSFSPNFWNIFYLRIDQSGNVIGTKLVENLDYSGFSLQRSPDNMIVGCGGVSNSGAYVVKSDENGYAGCPHPSVTLSTDSPTMLPGTPSWTSIGTLTSTSQTITASNISLVTSTICLGTEVAEKETSDPLVAFPNPVQNDLWIDFKELNSNSETSIQIFNSMGELVAELRTNNSDKIKLNIEGMSKGVYLLRIQNSEHLYSQKLLFQ